MAIYSAGRAAARAALGVAESLMTSYPKQPRSEGWQDDGQSAGCPDRQRHHPTACQHRARHRAGAAPTGRAVTLAALTSLQALSRPKPCWWLWLKPAWLVSHLAWRSSYWKGRQLTLGTTAALQSQARRGGGPDPSRRSGEANPHGLIRQKQVDLCLKPVPGQRGFPAPQKGNQQHKRAQMPLL